MFENRSAWLHAVNLCIGMMVFVIAYSVTDALVRSISRSMDKLGTDVVMINDKTRAVGDGQDDPPVLNWGAYKMLLENLGQEYMIAPVAKRFLPVNDGIHRNGFIGVWGTTRQFFEIVGIRFNAGRGFSLDADSNDQSCVAGGALHELGIGSEIGVAIDVGGSPCRIVGITSEEDPIPGFSVSTSIIEPVNAVTYSGELTGSPISQIILRRNGGGIDPGIGERIHHILDGKYDGAHFDVWLATKYWEARTRIVSGISFMAITLAVVIVGLAAVGLANGLLLDVANRKGEIGLRIAMGATRWDIFSMIVREGLVIVLVGGTAGVLAGVGLVALAINPLLAQSMFFDERLIVDVHASGVLVSLAFLLCVALAASSIPARRAAAIEPSLALRNL